MYIHIYIYSNEYIYLAHSILTVPPPAPEVSEETGRGGEEGLGVDA